MADKKGKNKEEKKGKVVDMSGEEIKPSILEETIQEEAPKNLEISIGDVNNFIAIVGVIMLNDDRKNVLVDHFINTIKRGNPDLTFGPVRTPTQE
jgi:hypothetical protein